MGSRRDEIGYRNRCGDRAKTKKRATSIERKVDIEFIEQLFWFFFEIELSVRHV